MHSVRVTAHSLRHCSIKTRRAEDLSREEAANLMYWCDGQNESLWDELCLQEILNVYRVSHAWEDWQSWASEEPAKACAAWNKATRRANHRSPI